MYSLSRLMFSLLLVVLVIGNFYAAYSGYQQGLQIAEEMLVQRLYDKHALLSHGISREDDYVQHEFVEVTLYQYVRDGDLLFASSNAEGADWLAPQPNLSFIAFNGLRWRSYTAEVEGGTLLVAERYDTYIKVLEKLLVSAVLPLLWIIPVIAVAILIIIRIGFYPLASIAKALQNREDRDFSPLNIERSSQELRVVVDSLNTLLSKLGAAFDREQRFASYAAHELRSPVTSMKLSLHNLLKSASAHDSSSLHALQMNVDRMQNTIEQLLLLAKIGDEQAMSIRENIRLHNVLAELIASLYSRVEKRHQTIELVGDDAVISANRFALEGALVNIIDNAIKYAPDGGQIRVNVLSNVNRVSILIEDSGPGIPENEIDKVFDRFYRVGADRHASGISGTGLGLSIVAQCLLIHDGEIALSRSESLGGLLVNISLPFGDKS